MKRIAQTDPAIARRFLDEAGLPRFGSALLRALSSHAYTTQVREMEGFLWRSLQSSSGDTLELTTDLAGDLAAPEAPRRAESVGAEEIRASLARHQGVKDKVWRELGLSSRHALHRLMKKLGVEDDE